MRGKVVDESGVVVIHGITPACAGKSRQCPKKYRPAGDHPRVCGEKQLLNSFVEELAGSPPRVRGKGPGHIKSRPTDGITPACAGKSLGVKNFRGGIRDHPRVCGEKSVGADKY